RLVVDQPLDREGRPTVTLANVSGTLTGQDLPTGVLRPLMAAAGLGELVDPERDLGPTVDIDAVCGSGADRAFNVRLVGEHVDVRLDGRLDDEGQAVQLAPSLVAVDVHPDLLAGLAPVELDRPVRVSLSVDGARLPLDASRTAWSSVNARGQVSIDGAAEVHLEGDTPRRLGRVERLASSFVTESLEQGVTLDGSMELDGATMSWQERVSSLVDDEGRLTLARARPLGRLTLQSLPRPTLEGLVPEAAPYVQDLGVASLDATLSTDDREGIYRIEGQVTLPGDLGVTQLDLIAVEGEDSAVVERAVLRGVVAPALLARLQADSEEPVVLVEPAPFEAIAEPLEVPGTIERGFQSPSSPLRLHVEMAGGRVEPLAGLVEQVGIAGLDVDVEVPFHEQASYAVRGGVDVIRPTRRKKLARVTLDARVTPGGVAPLIGRIGLEDIAVGQWARVLGRKPASLRGWFGASGGLALQVDPIDGGYRASITPTLPALAGTIHVTVSGDVIDVTEDNATLTLRREAVQSLLAADEASANDEPPASDVPLDLDIRSLRLPRGLLLGGPFDPGQARVDVRVTGAALEIVHPDRSRSMLRDLQMALRSDDLADGLAMSLTARSLVGDAAAGDSRVEGRLSNLFEAGGGTAEGGPRLDLDARVAAIPTRIVDALGRFDGLLVDALGERADAEISAEAFSSDSGTVAADLRTTNGWLRATLRGQENALHGVEGEDAEVELEVTPPLRQRLLASIHPIFGDVRTVEQPVRARGSGLVVPLDGDVARLHADLEITVGAVELDSGSALLGLLTAFDSSPRATVDGSIEPIVARVRDGIVTYDRFAVRIDRYTLLYQGQVDLSARTMDLRTEVPLAGLAMSIKELRGYADKIVVPLVTRGPFDDPRTEIDPSFDLAGAAAEAGFRGALDQLLREQGIDLGKVIDDLLAPPGGGG
ncbi:MAG: hypothetical protein ACYTGC_14975, partial [Planctomycetota bacterium]